MQFAHITATAGALHMDSVSYLAVSLCRIPEFAYGCLGQDIRSTALGAAHTSIGYLCCPTGPSFASVFLLLSTLRLLHATQDKLQSRSVRSAGQMGMRTFLRSQQGLQLNWILCTDDSLGER